MEQHRLDPSATTEARVLDEGRLREARDRVGILRRIARLQMEHLYREIAGSSYAILLTDSEGAVLDYVVDAALDNDFKKAGLYTGALWSEEAQGTNGIGTCIAEGRPVVIHQDEHFSTRNIHLTCAGAPIFSPQGELLAVLDISAVNPEGPKAAQRHTAALINASAKLIENCYFLHECRDATLLRFHRQAEFLGLPSDAMVALNTDGTIVAANGNAARELGVANPRELIGHSFRKHFEMEESRESQGVGHRAIRPVSARGAVTLFGQLQQPERQTQTGSAKTRASRAIEPSGGPPGAWLSLQDLAGEDPRMAYNLRCAERIANKPIYLILQGETGAGKEAFAAALHRASHRADQPFVAINCASIPETLIESELFGYRHGAFTGARREGMRGKLQQASGGTLFLDEIGDMPLALQARLLRVLEEQAVVPLGGDKPIPLKLHVISATHQDLRSLVKAGKFREDLYYRLNGLTLTLPPLRQRADLDTLLERIIRSENRLDSPVRLTDEVYRLLLDYSWPGNIRQLKNTIRSALALCDDNLITLADLPPEIVEANQEGAERDTHAAVHTRPVSENQHSPERETLLETLEQHRWNVSRTARALGISRNALYQRMKRVGIPTRR
ncbi:MAG: sigma-54-dependent Fis family transcriptional regulator [Gammaproteobacteria bacterium]